MGYQRIEERWINRDQKHLFRRIKWDVIFLNLALVSAFAYALTVYVADIRNNDASRWAIIYSVASGR